MRIGSLWRGICDGKGILLIDYLEKGRSITGEYCSNFPYQLHVWICEKRPDLKEKIMSHQDYAPAHKNVLAMGKLVTWGKIFSAVPLILLIWLPQVVVDVNILTAFQTPTSGKEFYCWRNAGQSVLQSREINKKNKIFV